MNPINDLAKITPAEINELHIERLYGALERATTLEDAHKLHSVLFGFEETVKRIVGEVDTRRDLAWLTVKCERKLGVMLEDLPKHQGQRTDTTYSQPANKSYLDVLSELGISKDSAARWRLIAKVPERDFSSYYTDLTLKGTFPKRWELVRMGTKKARGERTEEEREKRREGIHQRAYESFEKGATFDEAVKASRSRAVIYDPEFQAMAEHYVSAEVAERRAVDEQRKYTQIEATRAQAEYYNDSLKSRRHQKMQALAVRLADALETDYEIGCESHMDDPEAFTDAIRRILAWEANQAS